MSNSPPNHAAFADTIQAFRRDQSPAARACLQDDAWLTLPGHQPPWQPTGCSVVRGQQYSLFAAGRIQWSRSNPARYGGPSFHLWARVVPGGRIVNLGSDSGTFVADASGEIELGIYMGVWRDAYGSLATSTDLYQRLSGALGCWVVVWPGAARAGLEMLLACSDLACLRQELARLAAPATLPRGWEPLLETGMSAIYQETVQDGRRTITLDAPDAQGIITTPVDVPLTPATRLCWSWCADELPSELAEDRTHTHDYFSIGAEFDNGRDLTWIWSSTLTPETYFHCPVPAWTSRETHWVVRRGPAAPGCWYDESRAVHADVARAMGPPPRRIVRVWLIALATFQHGRARARFRDIRLEHGTRTVQVV